MLQHPLIRPLNSASLNHQLAPSIGITADMAPFEPQAVIEFLIRINSPLLPWLDAYNLAHHGFATRWQNAFTEEDWRDGWANGRFEPLAIFFTRAIIECNKLSGLKEQFYLQYHKPLFPDNLHADSAGLDVGWGIIRAHDLDKKSLEYYQGYLHCYAAKNEAQELKVIPISRAFYENIKLRMFSPRLGWGLFAPGTVQCFLIQESQKAGLDQSMRPAMVNTPKLKHPRWEKGMGILERMKNNVRQVFLW